MRTLGTINGEGFNCNIVEHDGGRVEFTADADIDADGANGQNGAVAAYRADNKGSEALANGGMGRLGGRVVGVASWWKDIALAGPDGQPLVLPSGVIPTKTAYRFPGTDRDDPAAYVDSETVPYIVVPPLIIQKTAGIVMGSRCRATNTRTGATAEGVVADVGPRRKIGEVSIAMARALGIPASPRSGGIDKPVIRYEIWPGQPGTISGNLIALQRSNGTHLLPPGTAIA